MYSDMSAVGRLPSLACDSAVFAGTNIENMQSIANNSLVNDSNLLADIAKPKRKRARKVLTEEQQAQKKLKRKAQLQTAQQIYRKKKMEKTNELVNENTALKQVVKDLHKLLKLRTNIDYLQECKDSLDETRHSLIRNIISEKECEVTYFSPNNEPLVENNPHENKAKKNESQIKKEDFDIEALCQNTNDSVAVCPAIENFDLENISGSIISNDTESKNIGFDLSFFENIDCISGMTGDNSKNNSYDSFSYPENEKLISNESTFGNFKFMDLDFIKDTTFDRNFGKDPDSPLSLLTSLDSSYTKLDNESPESTNTTSPFSINSWDDGWNQLYPQLRNFTADQYRKRCNSDSTMQSLHGNKFGYFRSHRHFNRGNQRYSASYVISSDISYRRRRSSFSSVDSGAQLNIHTAINDTHSIRNDFDASHHNMPMQTFGHIDFKKGIKYIDLKNSNSSDIDISVTSDGSTSSLENNNKNHRKTCVFHDFPHYAVHNHHDYETEKPTKIWGTN